MPEIENPLVHELYFIVDRDTKPAGFVCKKCNRVAWYDGNYVDCAEADEDVFRQLGERCESASLKNISFDLVAHLRRQREFSRRTFGPGKRTSGVISHIRKELDEVEKNPHDVFEWIDVAILAFDGAWRHGSEPEEIAQALAEKQAANERRMWPDWRTVPEGQAIEHVREDESHG